VLYQSIFNEKLTEGRNWVRKCAQATGMSASLRILSSKAYSNTWESFTRSELKLESVHQESPRSDIFRKRATKPLLKQKHRQKNLTWANEENNWTDEEERRDTESMFLKSSVKFSQSVMIWAAMSSAAVAPLCFLKSTVNADIYQDISDTSCFLLLTSFMEMLISFSSRTLAPAHTAKGTKSRLNEYGVGVLDWPANSPDLNPRESR